MFAEDELAFITSVCATPAEIEAAVTRRCAGERLEHVLRVARFGPLTLDIDQQVFVPRPVTVALAERAASHRPEIAVDLFSGCGAIACLLAHVVPTAEVWAGELSVPALTVLRRNAATHGVRVVRSDVDDGLPAALEAQVDVLVANVPYVPSDEVAILGRDAAAEPVTTLDGGADGLDWVRRLVTIAPRWLRPGSGRLLFECAAHQVTAVDGLLTGRSDMTVLGDGPVVVEIRTF